MKKWFNSLPLRNLVITFLVAYGIVPLAIGAFLSVRQQSEVLNNQLRVNLAHSVESQSAQLATRVESAERRLQQLGGSLLAIPEEGVTEEGRKAWVDDLLRDFVFRNRDLLDTRVLFVSQQREFAATQVAPEVVEDVQRALREALAAGRPVTRYVELGLSGPPAVAVTQIKTSPSDGSVSLVLGALVELPIRSEGEATAFLINRQGEVLWAQEQNDALLGGLRSSTLLRDFMDHPAILVAEYDAGTPERSRPMIAQVSPVGNTGLGVVVQQPKAVAFGAARRVAQTTVVAAALMIFIALAAAVGASQLVSAPIKEMARASGEIAAGNLGQRVPIAAVSRELCNLAMSFNSMSAQLETHVEDLRQAADANRELFLGSVRALLAAVEAKEPYTRGHSERVAELSRTIAIRAGLEDEIVEKIGVAGLLHDVGKIGIEDHILNKGDTLTPEEFERMKLHTVIGAEIMSSIEQLSYSVEVVRSHHERWNGKGYPDGLARTAIPLMARVVAVADSFDAMTTQRVYQEAMSAEQAKLFIRARAGDSFDPDVVKAFLKAYDAGDVRSAEEASEFRSAVLPMTVGQPT